MADDTQVATPESPATRTFQIPVENAAPIDHEHQGKTFKIPVEGHRQSFSIPVEAPPPPEQPNPYDPEHKLQAHADVSASAWTPSWWDRVKQTFTSGVGRNLGYGESFAHERARTIEKMTPTQYHEYREDQKKQSGKWYNQLEMVPYVGGILSQREDPLAIEGRTPGVNLGALMTPEERGANLQKGTAKRELLAGSGKMLDAFSEFTSPESAKSQLEWMVGSTLLEPLMGLALVGAGGAASKAGLSQVGKFLANPKTAAWVRNGTFFGPIVKDLGISLFRAVQHSDSGDPEHEEGAWGDIVGNMLLLVAMHHGMKAVEAGPERRYTEDLNKSAQNLYQKKFTDLDQQQKVSVLFDAVGTADPDFKARVDREVEQIKKQRKRGLPEAQELAGTLADQHNIRMQAAKTVLNQALNRMVMESAARQEAATREAEARRAQATREAQARREQYEQEKTAAEAAEKAKSEAEKRGFEVEEGRTAENLPVTGVRMTTEREPGERYAPEPTIPAAAITDRRSAAQEPIPETSPGVVAAESKVQGLVEDRMGSSWSSLPLSRQMVAARWLEMFHPGDWHNFTATPAHAEFEARVQDSRMVDAALKHYLDRNQTGSEEPLAPGADLQTGLAKLIIGRTDVDTSLKAHPEVLHSLNEHSEQVTGKSWDSLALEDRPAALAEFLRDKPDSLTAFLTPDLVSRIKSGQHVDLANMEAELADRQQVHMLMDFRDQIRRDMDAGVAARLLVEAGDTHRAEVTGILTDAQTSEDPAMRSLNTAAQELTAQGEELGLGTVSSTDDLFRIERDIKNTPDRLRTSKMRGFLTRMEDVRSRAQDIVARRLAEDTVNSFRDNPEEARDKAARQVIWYDGKSHDLQDAADNFRERGRAADADAAQTAANEAKQKADAIVAGVQTATNPPAPPAPAVEFPITSGAATRIVSPNNKAGMPAHYAIMEMTDAQTSHMPHTYEYREGYNQNGQPRDYKINKNAQAAVKERTSKLDMDILLSNDPQTMGASSVIDQRGHVISGNGRMLSLLESLTTNPVEYERYRAELARRSQTFGIDSAELAKYRNPVLVRVLDAPVDTDIEWARLGTELNADPTIGLSEAEQSVAMGRLLTPEYIDRLGHIIDSMPSIDESGKPLTAREAMRARSGEIGQLMTDAGIIKSNKRGEFLDNEGNLNERAKDAFENLLAGVTVNNPDVLQRAPANVKDKLTRVGMFFIRMQQAGENWNLASMNTDAVRLITRAQDAAGRLSMLMSREEMAKHRGEAGVLPGVTGTESIVEKFLHPERYHYSAMSLEFDGQPLHQPVHSAVEALAMALEEKPRDYSLMMAKFADRANAVQGSMFGAESPAEAFTAEIASKYGMKVVPEEWGSVVGFSEAVKDSIEEGRGPLPVEPETHAETAIDSVLPNSESVTEAIPEGPRNVQELRTALEAHPGVTQEDAAALTEVFENILPRAIGQDLNEILGNRRLNFQIGGEEGRNRGFHEILEDGRAMIALCDAGDPSTFIHEMAHYIRRYLRPEDQKVANEFVGAKPGEQWSDEQEEKFAQAFERYHYDGGIRRGKLEKVFATINRAMQSVYNAVTGAKLAKGSQALNAMFDNWYDWSRAERKPITARLDVDALIDAAKGKVEIPSNARKVQGNVLKDKEFSDRAENYIFTDEASARQFIGDKKNGIKKWAIYRTSNEEGATIYVRAEGKKGKKLYQPSLDQVIALAKQAKDLEARLRRETDPREQARLRAQLNGLEDRMRGATGIVGAKPEPRDTSVIQLAHGIGEMPSMSEPTTPAQAVTAHGVFGDPTSIELGGERGKPGEVPAEAPRVPEAERPGEVPRGTEPADREHGTERPKPAKGDIATPKTDPLAKVKAAKLKAPDAPRGTPVVDPEKWREHVEALGLPTGTPPPTVRLDPDVRETLIYPGQAEGVEGVLSALQQYDGTILASPAGSGKTYMLSAIANHLLGTSGDKVGLLITRSSNLIHEADGFVETARRFGVDVNDLPQNMAEMQTGMYAATYSAIRGNRDVLSVPWDFVLFDESAEGRNWTESDQGKAVVLLGHAAKKVVYSSATPYSTIMELGYMHKLGLWPKGGFTEWAYQFGLREVGPNTYSGGTSAAKLEKLRQQLVERGQWQQLYRDMDGTEAHVILVPQTDEVRTGIRNIRAAFAMARMAFQRARMSRYITPAAGHEVIYLKRYIEAQRLPQLIELTKKAVASGWRPVIFSEYRSGSDTGMEFFNNLPGDMGKKINAMLPPLPDVVETLRKEFGNSIGIFAGEANQLRAGELEEFQGGNKDAIYMTYAAGGIGASAHDKVGDKPRMGIFSGLPWSGIMFEQGTSRTWRYGTKSGAINVFFTSDALPEMKVLATKILPRMRSLNAAVRGEKMESKLSKNLRESAGIPEELLQYEHGEEVAPQAAEFEQDGDGVSFTNLEDYEMPEAKKFHNKGMKYKGVGRKLYQGPVERRQNAALRKRISEMSPEEMRRELLTSHKVDLPNGRAFDEAERDHPAPAVAMSDADGLKAFNDKFGYAAGDALLKAKADALKAAGLDAYHEKGDEFLYRGKSKEELIGKLERARDILRNRVFDVTMDDGRVLHLKGVDFSYGAGKELREAESGLHTHKAEREARGERKRGELAGITEVGREGEKYQSEMMAPPPKNGVTVAPTEHPVTYLTGSHNEATLERARERGDIGLLVTPLLPSYLKYAKDYPVIAIDNGVFSKSKPFDEGNFRKLIDAVAADPETAKKVRFVVAPDVVGDARATLDRFDQWADEIHSKGLPVALAAQDGLENMLDQIPWDKVDVLFIGGSTDWKIGNVENLPKWIKLFKEAKDHDVPIHMGRVNSADRLHLAEYGLGASTVDGTYLAFGPEKNRPNLEKWLNKQNARTEYRSPAKVSQIDEEYFHPTRPTENEWWAKEEEIYPRQGMLFQGPIDEPVAQSAALRKLKDVLNRADKLTAGDAISVNKFLEDLEGKPGAYKEGDKLSDETREDILTNLNEDGNQLATQRKPDEEGVYADPMDYPFMPPEQIIPEPKKKVYADKLAGGKTIPKEEADAKIDEWKAAAKHIGATEDHSKEVVISLFDRTGAWSQPYVDAGYDVRRYDIQNGDDLVRFFPVGDIAAIKATGKTIVGVLGAPPCTSFAVSGARWWKTQHDVADPEMVEKKYGLWATEYFDTPLDYAKTLVATTEAIIEVANPTQFHAIENPIGRIAKETGLPDPLLTFDPHNFGDPYTKRTQIWGKFNPELPTANVHPTEGSLIHKLRGDVEEDKARRSETPEGFAYAFFMANHGQPAAEAPIAPQPRESVAERVEERQRRLFQGPKDDDDNLVNNAWNELIGRTKDLPAANERILTANESILKLQAKRAAREAREAGQNPQEAANRKLRDAENDALIWLDDMKDRGRAASHFAKSTVWMFGMSGDRAVEAIAREAGFAKEGAELKRRIVDYDIRSGNYRGEFGGMVEKIISENRLKPNDLELVSKVVEGQDTSDDPRIQKAVKEFRQFTAYVRRRLAASGMSVVFYDEKGKRTEVPYSQIQEDPHYWPRVYDWNKKFVVDDGKGGKIVTSLSEIMNMPTGSERREMLIEKVAKQRGISKIKAQLFFDRNARGVRLAGNLERSREYEIPLYGRDRRALDRYVNEVAEKLASTEVHGQFREKTDPLIDALPDERTRRLINHIITADLDPARLHDSDRFMLRQANRWLVLSKMSLSTLKLPFHLARTTLATNTRSLVLALMKGITNPRQLRQNAVDCGAMVNYMRQAWLREYGMKTGGLDQKLLDFNGFTLTLYASRMIAVGAGRLWLEKYAYPELKRNPGNDALRRKLTDLYGYTPEGIDRLVEKGYGPEDVKRAELAAANWTTGSGRPSELPPALRGTSGDPIYDRLTTLLRISQSLHGYMFKTANLVNRTVWQELRKADYKSVEPYKLIARFSLNFGLAGLALSEILHIRHQMSGSPEADIEKRRQEWINEHPASKEALFMALSHITMGMGVDALTQFFDELATHDPKDVEKMVQQERSFRAAQEFVTGVAYQDLWTLAKAMKDYEATFSDTGPHKQTPEERRQNIEKRLLNQEWPISRYFVKPTPAPTSSFPHSRRAARMF